MRPRFSAAPEERKACPSLSAARGGGGRWSVLLLAGIGRGPGGPLRHLQGLGLVLSSADAAGEDCPAPQGLGQYLGGLGVGGEAAGDRILHIAGDSLRALLAVVLFQPGRRLDDGDRVSLRERPALKRGGISKAGVVSSSSQNRTTRFGSFPSCSSAAENSSQERG